MTRDITPGACPAADSTAPEEITSAVVASFAGCPRPRLRLIMQMLAHHLHAFAQEVELTQEEWYAGIRFLTDAGHLTTEERQEFILLSDTLGLSMFIDAINHEQGGETTESTVLGPFWAEGSPLRDYGAAIAERQAGVPAWVHGRVLDTTGAPLAGAELDVWQNGDDRLYAVQDPGAPEHHLRGRFRTRADGSYAFLAVRPTAYPIPDDGPVGRMLAATGRHPWRPAHIHIKVDAPGYEPLTTHIFDADSEYLDSDTVFAVKPSLIRTFVPRKPDAPERPAGVDGEWFSVENDLVLTRRGLRTRPSPPATEE
ncbi:intradiol ring-cleavage dioxygenase [Streptomyces sp. NPDC057474]|uniref:intradiol ring-cleavage dioxygenase n=1 Tax=Streptomyces sp. NPDC057474 TaxID=3346144 RepID=UPI0036A19C55